MLNKLAKEVHKNAVEKGFHERPKNIGEMLCLIHSEVSETLEADREGRFHDGSIILVKDIEEDSIFEIKFKETVKDTFEDELADIIIRVLDLVAMKRIDIESHIKAKMRYNKTRGYRHGKNY